MKIIELMRHSLKTGPGQSNLSPAGVELAERVGANELRGRSFTHLFVSPLKRTQDTLEALKRGAGDFPTVTPQIFPLHAMASGPEYMPLWEGACHRAEAAGHDMLIAALTEEPRLTNEIAKKGGEAFRAWLNELPDGARVLVIGHSPFFELIAYNLFGVTLQQLQPCEGFIITEIDGKLSLKT